MKKFAQYCNRSYRIWNQLVPNNILVSLIFKDMLKFAKIDWTSLFISYGYTLKRYETTKKLNKLQNFVAYFIELKRTSPLMGDSMPSEGMTDMTSGRGESVDSSEFTISTQEGSSPRLAHGNKTSQKGFKPRLFVSTGFSQDSCDLKTNTRLFNSKIRPLLANKRVRLGANERAVLREYFKTYTITDSQRREIWRNAIGNKLKITQATYQGLISRIKVTKVSKKFERMIQGDLDRTFPNCSTFKEGEEMYANMQRLLLMFHIYRPDIKYVQGMTYLISTLYYYYDDYETFVLFTNLILGKKLMLRMYRFEIEKVIDISFMKFKFCLSNLHCTRSKPTTASFRSY